METRAALVPSGFLGFDRSACAVVHAAHSYDANS